MKTSETKDERGASHWETSGEPIRSAIKFTNVVAGARKDKSFKFVGSIKIGTGFYQNLVHGVHCFGNWDFREHRFNIKQDYSAISCESHMVQFGSQMSGVCD